MTDDTTERLGFIRIDESMQLDSIELSLKKDGSRVDLWMASNPKPGRYELVRVEGGDPDE